MSEPTIDRPTFDALNELGDAAFVQELIDTFLAEAPLLLKSLRQALSEKNAEVFRRAAHSLKSNGKTFGALSFAEMARELEFMGRDGQLGSVGDKLENFASEYDRVAAALKGLRDG